MPSEDLQEMCFLCISVSTSSAASFCTDHINDRTEAWSTDFSLKVQPWDKEKSDCEGLWDSKKRELQLKVEAFGNKIGKLEQQCVSQPLQAKSLLSSQHFFMLFLPLFIIFTSHPPCPPVSLGPGHLPPHIITALLLLMLLLIRTPQLTPTTALLLSWSDLAFTLQEEGHSSISCVVMDKRGEGQEGRGEESIWLVNFNAEADVSLCSWKISGLEMCHAMIIQGNICSLYCRGAAAQVYVTYGMWASLLTFAFLILRVLNFSLPHIINHVFGFQNIHNISANISALLILFAVYLKVHTPSTHCLHMSMCLSLSQK